MADRMGLSMSYVHQLEGGKRTPSDSVETLVRILEQQSEVFPVPIDAEHVGIETRGEETVACRMIPVVSWAHAGEAESFEELPQSWQDRIPTECRDDRAFAVRLIGDSMGPLYVEGDMLILQPGKEIYSGCLAVVRLANDGILFRRVERRADRLVLVPLNPQYKTEEFNCEEISWAYPLWGMWRQVCK